MVENIMFIVGYVMGMVWIVFKVCKVLNLKILKLGMFKVVVK